MIFSFTFNNDVSSLAWLVNLCCYLLSINVSLSSKLIRLKKSPNNVHIVATVEIGFSDSSSSSSSSNPTHTADIVLDTGSANLVFYNFSDPRFHQPTLPYNATWGFADTSTFECVCQQDLKNFTTYGEDILNYTYIFNYVENEINNNDNNDNNTSNTSTSDNNNMTTTHYLETTMSSNFSNFNDSTMPNTSDNDDTSNGINLNSLTNSSEKLFSYDYDINRWTYYSNTNYLKGCPLMNETHCNNTGEYCDFGTRNHIEFRNNWEPDYNNSEEISFYDDWYLAYNESYYSLFSQKYCHFTSVQHGLSIDKESFKFHCSNVFGCYSAHDYVSFNYLRSDINSNNLSLLYTDGNKASYAYVTDPIVDDKDKAWGTYFIQESWMNGVLGIAYQTLVNHRTNSKGITSIWQILGLEEASNILGFDLQNEILFTTDFVFEYGDNSVDYSRMNEMEEEMNKMAKNWSNIDDISYSETVWFNSDYHVWFIYDLKACGINIFLESTNVINTSNYDFINKDVDYKQENKEYHQHRSYPAMLDTGTACLSLPTEYYDVLMNWIPTGECLTHKNTTEDFCYVPDYVSEAIKGNNGSLEGLINGELELPVLSFKVNGYNGENEYYIPLIDLIILANNDTTGNYRYCIEKRNKINIIDASTCDQSQSSTCIAKYAIVFGTRVLQSLFTVIDYKHHRVGFGNNILNNDLFGLIYNSDGNNGNNGQFESLRDISKNNNVLNGNCMIEKECNGDDTLNKAINKCEKPDCKQYWFYEYDTVTHTCLLNGSLYALLPFVLITVAVAQYYTVTYTVWGDKAIVTYAPKL